jgi:hypothetical protein
MISRILLLTLLLAIALPNLQSQQLPFRGAHSHNDYERERPLFDALDNGLISVEADVWIVDNELWVGHDKKDLTKERTLESLYLKPLQKLNSKHKIKPIILLIDFKSDAEPTYKLLKELLAKYKPMFTEFRKDTFLLNTVTVIISGNRPESLLSENIRYAALDGRFDDISFQYGPTFYPLISENWGKYFSWNGDEKISSNELNQLEELVKKCHQQQKLIRFWGLPNDPVKVNLFWELFSDEKIDLLGVDNPGEFKKYRDEAIN